MERLPTLMIDGAMMLLMYVTIVGLILCDLRAGIRKARQPYIGVGVNVRIF